MQVMGVEGVIQAGGIPSFEYMAPQIEKMVVSEYLGRRNFTSSVLKNGSYGVMTSGNGLSVGIREIIYKPHLVVVVCLIILGINLCLDFIPERMRG